MKYIHHNFLRKHWNTIEMQSNFIESTLCKFICIPADFFKRRQFTKMIWLNLLLFSLHGSNVTSGKHYSEKFYKFHRKTPSGLSKVKRYSSTGVFLWIFESFLEHLIWSRELRKWNYSCLLMSEVIHCLLAKVEKGILKLIYSERNIVQCKILIQLFPPW